MPPKTNAEKTKRIGPFRKYRESQFGVCAGVPGLFRGLVMQKNPYVTSYETFQDAMVEAMAEE